MLCRTLNAALLGALSLITCCVSASVASPAMSLTSRNPNILYDYKERRFYEIPSTLTNNSKLLDALKVARSGVGAPSLIPLANIVSASIGTKPIIYVADVNNSLAKIEVKGEVTQVADNSGIELLSKVLQAIQGGTLGAGDILKTAIDKATNKTLLESDAVPIRTAYLNLLGLVTSKLGGVGQGTLNAATFPEAPDLQLKISIAKLIDLGFSDPKAPRFPPADKNGEISLNYSSWFNLIARGLEHANPIIRVFLTKQEIAGPLAIVEFDRQNKAADTTISNALELIKKLEGYVGNARGKTFFESFVTKSGSNLKSAGEEYTISVSVAHKNGDKTISEREDKLVLENTSEQSFYASVVPISFAPARDYKFMKVLDDDDNPVGQTSDRRGTNSLPNAGIAFTYLPAKGTLDFVKGARTGICFGFAAPYEGFEKVSIGNVSIFLGLHLQKGDYGLILGAVNVREKILDGAMLNTDGEFITRFDRRWTWFAGFSVKFNLFGTLGGK